MTIDEAQRLWPDLRDALINNIRERLRAQPEDQRTIWDLSGEECSDNFPEVMTFVDQMFGVDPLDWLSVQIQLEELL